MYQRVAVVPVADLDEIARLRGEIERWRDSNNRLRAEMETQALRANTAETERESPCDAVLAPKLP